MDAPTQGVRVVHSGGGWCYLTWDPVPGAARYGQQLPDGSGSGIIDQPETGIFAIPPGDVRTARIRVAEPEPSNWVAVTVHLRAGDLRATITRIEEEGGPGPVPPPVPVVARVDPGARSVTAWWTSELAEAWDAEIVDTGGQPVQGQAGLGTPQVVFDGLDPDTRYGVRSRAWGAGAVVSDWSGPVWTRTKPDGPPVPPPAPTGLRVHCKTDRDAKAEWDASDADRWRVWLTGTGAPILETVTPLVKLTGLEPDTGYEVCATAVRGGLASEAAALEFTTLATVLPPDEPDPPPDIGADLPAPTGLHVRRGASGGVEAFWDDGRPQRDEAHFYVATVNGRAWTRSEDSSIEFDAVPGADPVCMVYGVYAGRLTGIARAGVTP